MKNLIHIEKPVRKRLKFNHNDITKVLFLNEYPQFTDRPFIATRIRELYDLSFTFQICDYNETSSALDVLRKTIKRVGLRDVTDASILNRLSLWIIDIIANTYSLGVRDWYEYFSDEIENYCKEDSTSLSKRNLAAMGGVQSLFDKKVTNEQLIWFSINRRIEKEGDIKMWSDLRDSVLPWLNIEMWQGVQKKKESTRENADYAKQKLAVIEENIEDLDIIN